MASGSEKIVKVKLDQSLWERLNHFAKQTFTEPETAIERLLGRHLPNLMENFTLALERLTTEEREVMEESYYCLMFLVSYADEHASLLEIRKTEKQLQALENFFGNRMVETLGLDKERKDRLFASIKTMSSEEIKRKLEKLHEVFNKMPQNLIDEYKIHLLDSCIAVAEASGESFFSGENISDVERAIIQTIVRVLEIPLQSKHTKLLKADFKSLVASQN